MSSAIPYYKLILKRHKRLPLDQFSLNELNRKLKSLFKDSKTPIIDKKKVNKHIKLLDDLLVNENYSRLEELLNKIHMNKGLLPASFEIFKTTSHRKMKNIWPQVHLIYELTENSEHIQKYEQCLKEEMSDEISLVNYFDIDVKKLDSNPLFETLKPIKMQKDMEDDSNQVMSDVRKYHKFLTAHQSFLTHLKIQPFEVVYPTSRFALPIHITKRDKILKEKVTYIKSLMDTYQPVCKHALEKLIDFSIENPTIIDNRSSRVNPYFFTYMVRKRQREENELNPYLRNRLRSKKLIPSHNNIRKIFKRYVMKQFYIEDNKYKMSWMQNFYEQKSI